MLHLLDAQFRMLDVLAGAGKRAARLLGVVFHGPGVADQLADDLVDRIEILGMLQLVRVGTQFFLIGAGEIGHFSEALDKILQQRLQAGPGFCDATLERALLGHQVLDGLLCLIDHLRCQRATQYRLDDCHLALNPVIAFHQLLNVVDQQTQKAQQCFAHASVATTLQLDAPGEFAQIATELFEQCRAGCLACASGERVRFPGQVRHVAQQAGQGCFQRRGKALAQQVNAGG